MSGSGRHCSFFPPSFLTAHASPATLHAFRQDVPAALWPTASALLALSDGDLDVPYDDVGTPGGLLRETFYGAVWDAKNVARGRNIAYTNHFLAQTPHEPAVRWSCPRLCV